LGKNTPAGETKKKKRSLKKREKHKEDMTVITKMLLSLGLALLLLIVINPVRSAEKGSGDFRTLHDDIQIGNLLTGLYLTDEQVAKITPLAREAGDSRKAFESRRDAFGNKSTDILAAVRNDVLSTGDARPETRKRFNETKGEFDKIEEAFRADMKRLNKKVQAILTDNQKCIVSEYKPCIIPIKSISNPERIGQSNNSDGIIKALSRARGIPAERYAEVKEKFLERIKPKLEKEMTEEEVPEHLKKIGQVVDEARAMSNEEFELKKSALAEKIGPNKKENENEALRRKIDRFLLNPRFPVVAEMRRKLATKN
jgi:hypothetical protein